MKDRLKNNIGLKILAVFFAVFLWWTVLNVDDPISTKKFNVGVTITNAEVITNAGKSYQIIDDTQSVVVSVKARRKVLAAIEKKDIVAIADLREMQDTSVPIRVSIEGFEGDYEEATATPQNIQLKVENTMKKTFPITPVATGTPRAGHAVGTMIVSPKTVDVSGPESLIGKISKVVARVDVSELKDKNQTTVDAEIQTQLLYYDAADNLLSKELLSSNCDKNGVTVSVDLWKTKKLSLAFNTSLIKPEKGYSFSGIEVEPKVVEVVGSPEILGAMDQLAIPAKVLEKDNISKDEELIVDITEYLPEGIRFADGSTGQIAVRILIEKTGTKTIRLATRAIQVVNPQEYKLQYEEEEVELTFSGSREVLDKLTQEDIVAKIDLSEYQETGKYDVIVLVTKMPEYCTYLEDATVHVTLSKK